MDLDGYGQQSLIRNSSMVVDLDVRRRASIMVQRCIGQEFGSKPTNGSEFGVTTLGRSDLYCLVNVGGWSWIFIGMLCDPSWLTVDGEV
jgi:hypothetical protein